MTDRHELVRRWTVDRASLAAQAEAQEVQVVADIGGHGGGLGPGGLGGNGGPPRLDEGSARKYSLTFTVMGRNVFNHVSLAPPVGVLDSQLFGKSTSIAGGFFGSSASNRSVELQAMFNF